MTPVDQRPEATGLPPVLLVDDEQAMLDVYQAALSPHFEVFTAPNTLEAEKFLPLRTFKVAVVDQFMPGETGMDFLSRLRRSHPTIKRVLVTGYMKPEVLLRGVTEAALFRYLTKPVRMSEMIAVIQSAVDAYDAERGAAT